MYTIQFTQLQIGDKYDNVGVRDRERGEVVGEGVNNVIKTQRKHLYSLAYLLAE